MKNKDWNLSEKVNYVMSIGYYLRMTDFKEFLRRLKEKKDYFFRDVDYIKVEDLDKLLGEKLAGAENEFK